MKALIPLITASLIVCSCSLQENQTLIGKWQLSEELMDIGDGKGTFKTVDRQAFIEFREDGTFSSTVSLCQAPGNKNQGGTGTYSVERKQIVPGNCANAPDRNISFELSGSELILNLQCIESCQQKYVKVS